MITPTVLITLAIIGAWFLGGVQGRRKAESKQQGRTDAWIKQRARKAVLRLEKEQPADLQPISREKAAEILCDELEISRVAAPTAPKSKGRARG